MAKRDYKIFDQKTLEHAEELLAKSIFINGAEVTAPPVFNAEYVQRILKSGTTAAFKLMVATTYEDDFKSGCLKLNYFSSFGDIGVVVATTGDDIRKAKQDGKYAIVLGSQITDMLEDGKLELLDVLYKLGMRVLQLAYQRRSLFADGSGEPNDAGLSMLGQECVKKMNQMGMMIDLSHVGERSTLEAIDLSTQPILISHSNVKSICNHLRNKSDDVIKALAAKGGVLGINAVSPYLTPQGQATLDDWLDHVEYVINLVGIDHISVGLDIAGHFGPKEFERQNQEFPSFGGLNYTFDQWHVDQLYEVEQWKNVIPGLISRGYSDEEIQKVIGGNILRIMDIVLGTNK